MLEVFDKNSKGLDLVENQGEAGGEVPEGGDSLFPQGSFQATSFKKHLHFHGTFARFNVNGILFRQRCSQALAGRDLTPSLCLNRLPFLNIVDYLDIVDIVDVGSIDHCLLNEYYGDGTPWF